MLTKFASSRTFSQFAKFSTAIPTAIYTWGNGTNGQLGHQNFKLTDGVLQKSYTQTEPRRMAKSKSFVDMAVGGDFTLAICSNGNLYGWGSGYLGSQESKEPHIIPLEVKAAKVSAGSSHAAIIDVDGNLWTWGKNGNWFTGGGKLGHNSLDKESHPRLVESLKSYGARIKAVSCANDHTLVLTDDGELLSCGMGEYGRLGTGSTSDATQFQSISSLIDETIVDIACGATHSLCLSDSGIIHSWGCNDKGQLGINVSTLDFYSMEVLPRVVETSQVLTGDRRAVQVAAGDGRSAFITADGKLYLWGTRRSTCPEQMDSSLFNGLKVVDVSVGGQGGSSVVACITEDGGLWTLGEPSPLLGNPAKVSKVNLANSGTPAPVPKFTGMRVLNVYAGLASHLAARVEYTPVE